MNVKYFLSFMSVLIIFQFTFKVEAKEIKTAHQGLTLNGNLELATGKKYSDGVILITHGGLAHHGMEAIVYLQELFKELGYNTLAINLSLGINNRHGMYNCKQTHRHRHDDAVDEINTWIGWLKSNGVKKVTLLGHSRGGGQTALYAVERDSDFINAVVLMAPQTKLNGGAGYQQRYKKPLAPIIKDANKLIRAGKGETVLKHANILFCRDIQATANSFVSYYGPDPRLDSPLLISKIRKPTLVLIAGDDEVVVGLKKRITPIAKGKQVQMKVIEASDHFFRDLFSDDAVAAIDQFLKTI